MTWLLESELPRSPSTVLEVGRDRPDLGLLGAAVMWICADCPHDNLAPVEDLVDWVAASPLEPDSQEGKLEDAVLHGMTQILSLRQARMLLIFVHLEFPLYSVRRSLPWF